MRDGRETDGEQLGSEGGSGGEESAAAHTCLVGLSSFDFARVTFPDLVDRPENERHDGADD